MPRWRQLRGALLWSALLLFGCNTRGERTVKDSEGRTFALRCDEHDRSCAITQSAGPKSARGGAVLRAEGRLIGVCDGAKDSVSIADCRPLLCQEDADCPALHGQASHGCINGLCVDATRELGPDDSVMLCLAGQGLGHGEPRQVERYALGLNCGTPCRTPSPCRQP